MKLKMQIEKNHRFLPEFSSKKKESHTKYHFAGINVGCKIVSHIIAKGKLLQLPANKRDMLGDQKVEKLGQNYKVTGKAKNEFPIFPPSIFDPFHSISPFQIYFSNRFTLIIVSFQPIIIRDNNFENSNINID